MVGREYEALDGGGSRGRSGSAPSIDEIDMLLPGRVWNEVKEGKSRFVAEVGVGGGSDGGPACWERGVKCCGDEGGGI